MLAGSFLKGQVICKLCGEGDFGGVSLSHGTTPKHSCMFWGGDAAVETPSAPTTRTVTNYVALWNGTRKAGPSLFSYQL